MKKLLILLLFLFPSTVLAAPSVSSISGTIANNSQIIISGSNFGTKNPAKPYLWAPFNNGSISPSNLGTITSWTGSENLAFNPSEGVGGTGCAKATDNSGVWTLWVTASGFGWNDYNQQMYLFRKIKRNFDITSSLNWKNWRLWAAGYTYPNIYINTGFGNLDVEGIYAYAWFDGGSATQGAKDVFNTQEIIFRSNSNSSSDDTYIKYDVNGSQRFAFPSGGYSLKTKNDSRAMVMNFVVHGVQANTSFSNDYRYWADDVYLDTTWSRVMIGNSSTWAGSTKKEPQIPSAWSVNSITLTANQGSFTNGQQAYLYVVDSTGAVNASGYPVTIGSGTPPPAAKKGDLNSDGKVDVQDLGIFLSNWGKTTKPPSDLNQDGKVDVIDLGILLSNWG